MALTVYLVQAPAKSGQMRIGNCDTCVVVAESSNDAKAMAKAARSGDPPAMWDNATVTAITAGSADFEGWTFRVQLLDTVTPAPATIEVVGVASDTLDLLGAAMVTALEAHGGAALTPSYAANVLTVAAAGDTLGDKNVAAALIPPGAVDGVPGLIGTITDGGAAGAAITIALAADAAIVPRVVAALASA